MRVPNNCENNSFHEKTYGFIKKNHQLKKVFNIVCTIKKAIVKNEGSSLNIKSPKLLLQYESKMANFPKLYKVKKNRTI